MQLKRISGQGFLSLRERFDIAIDNLNGELTAVTGANGAGKSTLLELYPAALYRQMPTRDLKDIVAARDAFVEVTIVTDQEYTIRQTMDGVSGKQETSLTNAAGQAVLTSGKVTEYDQWAAKHLPPPNAFA